MNNLLNDGKCKTTIVNYNFIFKIKMNCKCTLSSGHARRVLPLKERKL